MRALATFDACTVSTPRHRDCQRSVMFDGPARSELWLSVTPTAPRFFTIYQICPILNESKRFVVLHCKLKTSNFLLELWRRIPTLKNENVLSSTSGMKTISSTAPKTEEEGFENAVPAASEEKNVQNAEEHDVSPRKK